VTDYNDLIEIAQDDANLTTGGVYPGFYWASSSGTPAGSAYIDPRSGLIVRDPLSTQVRQTFTGWSHIGFDQQSEHGAALLALDIPTARITHQNNESVHWVMPYIAFYPLIKAWMGVADIKNIDYGSEVMKRRGYSPGDRAGIAYGWRKITTKDGRETSKSYIGNLAVPRFMLRGTAGLFADHPGITPETAMAIPFRFGDDGVVGTERYAAALCDGQRIAKLLHDVRGEVYKRWAAFYQQNGMDLEPVQRLQEWYEQLVARGQRSLPPIWIAHIIGPDSKTTPAVGKNGETSNVYASVSYLPKEPSLEQLLDLVAYPYEIDAMAEMVPAAIVWSKDTSTFQQKKDERSI
jgi:hypothetical protein